MGHTRLCNVPWTAETQALLRHVMILRHMGDGMSLLAWSFGGLLTKVQRFLDGGWRKGEQTWRKEPYKGADMSECWSGDLLRMSHAFEDELVWAM